VNTAMYLRVSQNAGNFFNRSANTSFSRTLFHIVSSKTAYILRKYEKCLQQKFLHFLENRVHIPKKWPFPSKQLHTNIKFDKNIKLCHSSFEDVRHTRKTWACNCQTHSL
jgi:hypothetical protein